MPYCTQCGRKLENGEKCNCTASEPSAEAPQQSNYSSVPPNDPRYSTTPPCQPYPQGYPPPYYYGQPMQPQKMSKSNLTAIIIGLSIGFVVLTAILAAILVPSMLGYAKKSRQTKTNNMAGTLYRAANTALVELDELGEKTNGKYIIASSTNDNVAVPFDIRKFDDKLERYITDENFNKYEYFIVADNGVVEYAAVCYDWTDKKKPVGTYPSSVSRGIRTYSEYGGSPEYKDEATLDELYWDAYDKIFNRY